MVSRFSIGAEPPSEKPVSKTSIGETDVQCKHESAFAASGFIRKYLNLNYINVNKIVGGMDKVKDEVKDMMVNNNGGTNLLTYETSKLMIKTVLRYYYSDVRIFRCLSSHGVGSLILDDLCSTSWCVKYVWNWKKALIIPKINNGQKTVIVYLWA